MFDKRYMLRYIKVKDLKKLLYNLHDDNRLYPNQVGNLSIVKDDGKQIGYIDLTDEEIIMGE